MYILKSDHSCTEFQNRIENSVNSASINAENSDVKIEKQIDPGEKLLGAKVRKIQVANNTSTLVRFT